MRYSELFEDTDVLSQQPLGTVITYTKGSGFSQSSIHYMKISDGTWHKVDQIGYERGLPRFADSVEQDTADIRELNQALAAGNLALSIEGIHVGDTIKNSIQVHALPDNAIITNPASSVKSVIQKNGNQFKVISGSDVDGNDLKGKVLPGWAFTPENAKWER